MDRTRAFFDRLTYWLDAQVQAPASHRDGSARHDPDLFLQDFRAVTFDERGRPSQVLAAAKAEHFPDNDTAELVDLRDEGAVVTGRITADGDPVADAEIFFAHLDQNRSAQMFGDHNFVFSGEMSHMLKRFVKLADS